MIFKKIILLGILLLPFKIYSQCVAPAITIQPQYVNVCNEGGTAVISITATGTNLQYQWYTTYWYCPGPCEDERLEGTWEWDSPISGATSSQLTIPNCSSNNNNDLVSYACRITNSCGNAWSDEADYSVQFSPELEIYTEPENATITCARNPVSIILNDNRGNAINFLWSNNETTQNITVNPYVTTNYTVTATNIHGCSASSNVTILVDQNCGTASLKDKPDGSYFLVTNAKITINYNQDYQPLPNEELQYVFYDKNNKLLSNFATLNNKKLEYGYNQFLFDFSGKPNGFYLLEITDSKKFKHYLRFEIKNL